MYQIPPVPGCDLRRDVAAAAAADSDSRHESAEFESKMRHTIRRDSQPKTKKRTKLVTTSSSEDVGMLMNTSNLPIYSQSKPLELDQDTITEKAKIFGRRGLGGAVAVGVVKFLRGRLEKKIKNSTKWQSAAVAGKSQTVWVISGIHWPFDVSSANSSHRPIFCAATPNTTVTWTTMPCVRFPGSCKTTPLYYDTARAVRTTSCVYLRPQVFGFLWLQTHRWPAARHVLPPGAQYVDNCIFF